MGKTTGQLIVISGPPAGGKDAVRRELAKRGFGIIVTTTSRPQRADDLPGDYEYVSVSEFDQLVIQGVFADISPVHKGYRYGTRKGELLKSLDQRMVWRIDPTSAANCREILAKAFELEPATCQKIVSVVHSFWIMPEDEKELELRLRNRDGHDEGLLNKALTQVRADMDFFEKNRDKYDHMIINRRDKLIEAVDEIENKLG